PLRYISNKESKDRTEEEMRMSGSLKVEGWPANQAEKQPIAPKATPEDRPGSKTVSVVRGQYHRFMLIPIQDDEAEFFPAGPITFGIESRVLGHPDGRVGERGASLHVFNADRSEEY